MKLQAPIKGIFFDLGWTLIAPRSGNWMLSNFAARYFPREGLEEARKAGMDYMDTHHLLSTMEEEHALFQEYYTMLAKALPEREIRDADIKAITDDHVYNADNSYVFEDAISTLEALKGKYKLGVLSDTWPSIVPKLKAYGLYDYFDCFTFSYELGVYKPNPQMYEDALSKMGLPPEQTIFIDDFTGNLEGAQAAGIQPVLIQAKPDADDTDKMPKIKKVSELLEILP